MDKEQTECRLANQMTELLNFSQDRKFLIQQDIPAAIFTAIRHSGEQILALVEPFGFYVAFFDEDGTLLKSGEFEAKTNLHTRDLREQNLEVFRQSFDLSNEELGQTLTLRRFETECGYGIFDLATTTTEILENKEGEFTPEDIEEAMEYSVKGWMEAGYFSLVWPDEYYMNCRGEIESS